MYVGRDFDPSDTVESEVYTFNFVNDINTDETLSTATFYCTVADDSEVADASASTRLAGVANITGTKVSQRVETLQEGVKYVLQAVVTTNQSNTRSLWSHIPGRDPH